MINRFYYTIEDLSSTIAGILGWNKLFSEWLGTYSDTQVTAKLFSDVEDNFYDDYVCYIDISAPVWEIVERPDINDLLTIPEYKKQIVRQLRKIRAWLEDSKYKYEKLIQLYADNENKLMDQIKSESSTQFNDTPQTTISGLDSDEYATTYTKNKTAIDSGTVMARLSEVRAYWDSLYSAWVKEFSKKFVYYI